MVGSLAATEAGWMSSFCEWEVRKSDEKVVI
jgi:hypothetical protein